MTTGFPRPLTRREREVLSAMLGVQFDGVERLRAQADVALAFGYYEDGPPSIYLRAERAGGLFHQTNGAVPGTYDGVVLWTSDGELHSLEYFGAGDQFPDPDSIVVSLPGR